MSIFFTMFGMFLVVISSDRFSVCCSLSSTSGTPYDENVVMLDVVPEAP